MASVEMMKEAQKQVARFFPNAKVCPFEANPNMVRCLEAIDLHRPDTVRGLIGIMDEYGVGIVNDKVMCM
jgi:hypothetical protein